MSDCDDTTARQVCHALGGDEMTLALVTLVDEVDLPPTSGLSVRAARAVLRAMARVAGDDGEFRYGMRQAKVTALAEYSSATIKRAQRFLVERGLLARVAVGGGRRSTRWRICVDRLRPAPPAPPPPRPGSPRASCQPSAIQQLGSGEPALGHSQIFPKSYTPSGPAEPVTEVCQHGQRAGLMPTKALPWCPICRRLTGQGGSLRR